MFDKAFFKFALGFSLILAVSMCTLYAAGYWKANYSSEDTATVAP